jgi:hypothetical protein
MVSKKNGRTFAGTNLHIKAVDVPASAHQNFTERTLALMHSIDADDNNELSWMKTLRPARSLIHPAEAFLQGIKKLRPALHFNTFDESKLASRRSAKRQKEKRAALKRRDERMVPTVAMKAVNLKKIPRTGGHATTEEVKFLSRGKENKRALDHIAAFHNKKSKLKQSDATIMGAKKERKVSIKKAKRAKIGSKL